MNNMKKTLLIILCCYLTIGMQAQTTKLLREYQNPKIEGLLNYAESLGREVTIVHTGEDRYVDFSVEMYNDVRYPVDEQNPDRETYERWNREHYERRAKSALLIDSIRNTFIGLLDDANKSYMWDYHHDGVDSMYYTVALGKYNKGEVKEHQRKDRERELEYSFAPEILTFRFYQDAPRYIQKDAPSSKGLGELFYKYQPEVSDSNEVEVDMTELMKEVGKVLKKNKVKYRTLQTEIDSTYDWNDREIITSYSRRAGTTTSRVYDSRCKEETNKILEEIKAVVWNYLDKHPHADFTFINRKNAPQLNPMAIRVYKGDEESTELFNVYVQYLDRRNEYCFLISTSKGNYVLPAGWGRLKSWKNGAKKYYQ